MTHAKHHHNVATSRRRQIVWHPRYDDIICGRGPTKHPGNRMYHELVNDCRADYQDRNLPRGHKKLIARSIVYALRPGRFLIKQQTRVKPNEEEDQLAYPCYIVHDDNDKRHSDDACDSDKDKVETCHDIGKRMSSDVAISQSASFDSYSSPITSTTTSTSRSTRCGSSTPQQEGVYYYLVLGHEEAICKTSQALREKGDRLAIQQHSMQRLEV